MTIIKTTVKITMVDSNFVFGQTKSNDSDHYDADHAQ